MRLKSRRWSVALALVASLAWADVSAQSAPPSVTFGTLPVLQSTTPVPGSTRIPGDFNGDRMSDLLWFDPLESKLGYWLMDVRTPTPTDRAITKTGTRLFDITPGYFVGAVGDFNADGYADLMFTSSHRDLWLWTNNGRGAFKSARSYDYPAGWQLVGAGDIDGNGYDDLLWLNPDGCQFAYWLMKGGVRVGSRTMDVSCGYYPIGVGYYTPSNRLSILWSSPANDLYIWDSTGKGFRTYDLSADVPMGGVWALGGGFKGRDIGIEHNDPSNSARRTDRARSSIAALMQPAARLACRSPGVGSERRGCWPNRPVTRSGARATTSPGSI